MKNLETIQKLLKTSGSIKNLFFNLLPKWAEDTKYYDKVRYGFKSGSADGWYQPIPIFFEAWCGTYGDSSTYKQVEYDKDIFEKHFLKYLNDNKSVVMISVAESIEREAIALRDKAKEELTEAIMKLDSIGELETAD